MDSCNIVTVINGMVERIETFTQGELNDTPNIEQQFLAEVERQTGAETFALIQASDKEAYCDDGYAPIRHKEAASVQIHWEIG